LAATVVTVTSSLGISSSVTVLLSGSTSNSTYLPYVLSSDPYGTTQLYIHKFFPSMSISASGDVYGYTSSTAYGPYDHARTPNIISQYDDDLFSIHAISDGTISNT